MDDKIFVDGKDDLYDDNYWADLNDQCIADSEAEKLAKVNFKKGLHTHAYREDLLNSEIIQRRKAGLSLTKIAHQLGCSPSTVRNRLNKLKSMKLV